MILRRLVAPLVAVASLLALAQGCTSSCMQVQQILCTCTGQTQNEINACEDAASAQAGLAAPTAAQLTVCEALIPTCQATVNRGCATLQTPEGKKACGLTN